jgi:hypothetical protein
LCSNRLLKYVAEGKENEEEDSSRYWITSKHRIFYVEPKTRVLIKRIKYGEKINVIY